MPVVLVLLLVGMAFLFKATFWLTFPIIGAACALFLLVVYTAKKPPGA